MLGHQAVSPQGGARAGSQTGCPEIAGQSGQFSWALHGQEHRRPRRTWTVIFQLPSSIHFKENCISRLDQAVFCLIGRRAVGDVYLVGAPVAAVPAFFGSPISLPRSVLSHRRPRQKLPRRRARRTLPAVVPRPPSPLHPPQRSGTKTKSTSVFAGFEPLGGPCSCLKKQSSRAKNRRTPLGRLSEAFPCEVPAYLCFREQASFLAPHIAPASRVIDAFPSLSLSGSIKCIRLVLCLFFSRVEVHLSRRADDSGALSG